MVYGDCAATKVVLEKPSLQLSQPVMQNISLVFGTICIGALGTFLKRMKFRSTANTHPRRNPVHLGASKFPSHKDPDF